jgi:hypothetical protein
VFGWARRGGEVEVALLHCGRGARAAAEGGGRRARPRPGAPRRVVGVALMRRARPGPATIAGAR